MGLVTTWLSGIGFSADNDKKSILNNFKAAGIVTPSSLAELSLDHYEALGVKDAADRRKLFYLIQRIKATMEEEEEANEDDSLNYSCIQEVDDLVSQTFQEEQEPVPVIRKRSTRLSSSMMTTTSNNTKENRQKKTTKSSLSAVTKRNDDGGDDDDDGDDDDGHHFMLSNDADSTRRKTKKTSTRRQSRRILEQQQRTRDSVQSGNDGDDDDDDDEPAKTTTSSRRTSYSRSSSAKSLGYNNSGELEKQRSRRQHLNGTRRSLSSSNLDSTDDESTTSSSMFVSRKTTKKTGLQAPSSSSTTTRSSRRSRLQNPTSARTGKRLSMIPANQEAPMSPIQHIPLSTKKRNEKQRRKSSTIRVKSAGSDSEGTTSSVGSATSRSSRLRKSTGAADIVLARSKPRALPRLSTSSISAESTTKESVFVHGAAVDNSWGTQVNQLREDNQSEHDLFHGHTLSFDDDEEMRIRVLIRKRPMSSSEARSDKEVDVIHPLDYDQYGRVLVYQPKTRVDLTREIETIPFAFDNVFDETSTNRDIYNRTVKNLIPGVFEGRWASCFAYGQTGSGKTFTMMGCNITGVRAGTASHDQENLGLYYMAAMDVFELARLPEFKHLAIGASLFEIYSGKLFDLLNDRKTVKCLEDSRGKVCFPGLSEHPVRSADQLMQIIQDGASNRSTGTTSKNADSSRSHAVLQLCLRKTIGRRNNVEHGRLTFIDLAGSERGADTAQASRATRLEGAEINTSLLALKEVIRALATGDSMKHIPFRGSKLTQVLKESFVGKNSRSVMVACIAPNISNCEHTLNTLRYADRVKERDSLSGNLSHKVACSRKQRVSSSSSSYVTNKGITDLTVDEYCCDDSSSETIQETEDYNNNNNNNNNNNYESAPPVIAEENSDDELLAEFDCDESIVSAAPASTTPKNYTGAASADHATPDFAKILSTRKKTPGSSSSRRSIRGKPSENLINTHRAVMTQMLGMVKQEMELVNTADADRTTIDNYLDELGKIHKKQVNLLASLHEKLEGYSSRRAMMPVADLNDDDDDDDDSFEDLRD